jgi:predicted nucleic acid-binding protein
MIVVADTSPLNYLILIGEIEILPKLYDRVLLPEEVHRELQRAQTPSAVREWAASLPLWCEARRVHSIPDADLSDLDPGERDAILLALESGVDTVLMDEAEGRREAQRRRLRVTGTVAVLEKAAGRGLTDFRTALQRLDQTNFRLSPALRELFLRRNP